MGGTLKNNVFCFIAFTLLCLRWAVAQNFSLTGIVTDKKTKEPLAFVNLTYNHKQAGTTTDIDGKFKITAQEEIKLVKLTYVGYVTKTVEVPAGTQKINIELEQSDYSLKEVIILPGENPAHSIIRKVQQNKELNSPQNLPKYRYISYSKLIMTGQRDTIQKIDENDTTFAKATRFFNKQHLFLIEQITEKKYKYPEKETETILAARVSGFQNPSFLSLFTQLMSFGFYQDVISISDKDYINPIASGTFNKYSFTIEDTLYYNNDSIFVISFRPKKGKNFDGLKGVLYISSNRYAISNVIAEPNEDKDGTTIKIQQKYEFIENKQWFPTQLNSDIVFGNIKINGYSTIGIGRTYIKEIDLNPDFKSKDFRELGLIQADDAHKKDNEFWDTYRQDTLTRKDLKTYERLDSIGKKQKFDQKLRIAETVLSNKIRYKFLDFDLDKFLNYNDFEGLRIGISASTNKKFSQLISVGGFSAFGTSDKALKYGAHIDLNVMRSRKMFLRASFAQDLIETAGQTFYAKGNFLVVGDDIRKILLERLDSVEKYELLLHLKPFNYGLVNLYINQQYRQFTKKYLFSSGETAVNQAVITEAGLNLYYAFGEKILKFGNIELTEASGYPIIFFNYAKGFNNLFEGQHKYNRFDLKISKSFKTKFFGRTHVQSTAGYIRGNLPYSMLYNGNGSNKRTLSLSVINTFETMRMNEFGANQFASLFILHDFGRLLYRSKRFEPRIAMKFNAGFGKLNNPQSHQNIALSDFSKGYYEGGILINSILKSSFSNLGVGAFYRLGPYSNPKVKDNLAVKLSLGFSF